MAHPGTLKPEIANAAKRHAHPGPTTVAPGFVTGMLAGLRRAGRDPAPLLAAAGIAGNGRVPLERYADLYNRVAAALADEAFGLFPTPMRPGSFELLCRAVLSAGTLAEALERIARYLDVLLPAMAVELRRDGDRAVLALRETAPLAAAPADPARVFAHEWLLRLIHSLCSWLVGRGLALERVAFPYPRPDHAGDYPLIYTARSDFGAPFLEARFDAALLGLPIRRDEAALRQFLRGAPGRITALYRRDRETVLRVRRLLREALPASLDLEAAAGALHLSPRTLHRRLAEEGTSFRSIKDAVRRDLALERLAKTRDRVARIAADLGYADPSAFFRAFTDWTGVSPSAYRARFAGTAR